MGWIKLDRQIQDNFLYMAEPFDKCHAWIDLLLLANHEDAEIMFNGNYKTIKRGQHLTSIDKLSKRWKWSRNKVFRFLDVLRTSNMITSETTNGTIVTIVNYDKFQKVQNTNGTGHETTDGTGGETIGETQTRNKRTKEYKNAPFAFGNSQNQNPPYYEEVQPDNHEKVINTKDRQKQYQEIKKQLAEKMSAESR